MADYVSRGPLTGEIQPAQSKTISSVKKLQLAVVLGTAAQWLLDHSDTIRDAAMVAVPPQYMGVAVGAVQLGTAALALVFGKKAINARINATEKIRPVNTSVIDRVTGPSCLFLLMAVLLLFVTTAEAQQAPVVTFNWTYDSTQAVKGFRIFKGTNLGTLQQLIELPAAARSYPYTFTDTATQCFGIQAFTDIGVSVITSQQDDGSPVCLGKPAAPRGFSYKVQ